jgi:hypothetical protein
LNKYEAGVVGVGEAGAVVCVAVGAAEVEVAVGTPPVGVAVGGAEVAVGAVVFVGVGGATTRVLVGVGSGVFVAVGSGVKVGVGPSGVEVNVGCMVGPTVTTLVGVATGWLSSRETIRRSTVKMKPLRKTRIPRMSRYLSFIPSPLLFAPIHLWRAQGMTSACPTRMAFGSSSPFA